jgi:hypothetical protein
MAQDYLSLSDASIASDYYFGSVRPKSLKSLPREATKEEKKDLMCRHFHEYLMDYDDISLLSGAKGIVNVQEGKYPYDLDVHMSAKPSERFARRVHNITNKVMYKLDKIFRSQAYWLENDRLTQILPNDGELRLSLSQRAIEVLAAKEKETLPTYVGEEMLTFNGQNMPFRVWKGRKYYLVSLLNGSIFELAEAEMPKGDLITGTFKYGCIKFTPDGHGNFDRQ